MSYRKYEVIEKEYNNVISSGMPNACMQSWATLTRRIVQKHINVLKDAGRIERVGGKRYGHWEVR